MNNKSDIVLNVEDLSVSFKTYSGDVQAVRNISLNLKKGETIAIVGESGSGKSVTTKAIMGILSSNATIASGKIDYEGLDLTKINEKQFQEIRGRKLGLIFQDPLSALNPIMKIGKQITEVLLRDKKMSKSEAREKAIEIMESVGIRDAAERFDQYPFQFSGGMRQRIVIAIALANDPEVLICDEPTTALDVTVQAKILDLIEEIKIKRGLSVIFITHDLGVVANIADRVYVMYAGKVVEEGTCEEVFLEPAHPYTWALLSSVPDLDTTEELAAIAGTPPNMTFPPVGDAFAERNQYALNIDFKKQPPRFKISDTHFASTWLLHPNAPKVEMPPILKARIARMKEEV